MTPVLRKWHRFIWYTLAILLPLVFLLAVLAIPPDIQQNMPDSVPETPSSQ